MPFIRVGDRKQRVSWAEYHAAILPERTMVYFEHRGCKGQGVFLFSWLYEDIIAEVDVGGVRRTLHPALGDRMRRLRPKEKRFHEGEGI